MTGDRFKTGLAAIPATPFGGYSTSSPIFYSIPWNPLDFSVSGLGPGQSSGFFHPHPLTGELGYSKAGFTYYNDSKCACGFLSEYRTQYNRQNLKWARPNCKPWWNGREMTSKFDPKYPCHPKNLETVTTYKYDYGGTRGCAADICYPEGEIERARRVVGRKFVDQRMNMTSDLDSKSMTGCALENPCE